MIYKSDLCVYKILKISTKILGTRSCDSELNLHFNIIIKVKCLTF